MHSKHVPTQPPSFAVGSGRRVRIINLSCEPDEMAHRLTDRLRDGLGHGIDQCVTAREAAQKGRGGQRPPLFGGTEQQTTHATTCWLRQTRHRTWDKDGCQPLRSAPRGIGMGKQASSSPRSLRLLTSPPHQHPTGTHPPLIHGFPSHRRTRPTQPPPPPSIPQCIPPKRGRSIPHSETEGGEKENPPATHRLPTASPSHRLTVSPRRPPTAN